MIRLKKVKTVFESKLFSLQFLKLLFPILLCILPAWAGYTPDPFFTANEGQWNDEVLFRAEASGTEVWLTSRGTMFIFSFCQENPTQTAVQIDDGLSAPLGQTETLIVTSILEGACGSGSMEGLNPLPHRTSFYFGDNPDDWKVDVLSYSETIRRDSYHGIHQRYYFRENRLKYDFIVDPGRDPSVIRIRYSGVEGMEISPSGDLHLLTDWLTIVEKAPIAFQKIQGDSVPVACSYLIDGDGTLRFSVEQWDRDYQLIIDPMIEPVYSTYLGGSRDEYSYGIAGYTDNSVVIAGYTSSIDFPVKDPYQGTHAGSEFDVFVSWISADGNQLLRSTYIGGSQNDYARGIAIDDSGAVYLAGWTESPDFPMVNAFQPDHAGLEDAFVLKFSPDGERLEYSTFLGGSGNDSAKSIALNAEGNAFITGYTASLDFPIKEPFQKELAGSYDAFVSSLSTAGDSLRYSTYIGGSQLDVGRGIAVDTDGCAFILGETTSLNYPLVQPFQSHHGGGQRDMFVSKLSSEGSTLHFSTYLGGDGQEYGFSIVTDVLGRSYLAGLSGSSNFPTKNPVQDSLGGQEDAVVTCFSPAGDQLIYSTYLGGSLMDRAVGIAIDSSGRAYVTGSTLSPDFPVVNFFQGNHSGGWDTFVTEISEDGLQLLYSTFLGGSGHDYCIGITVDPSGRPTVTGRTMSVDYPLLNPLQEHNSGGWDAFITRLTSLEVSIGGSGGYQPDVQAISVYPNPFFDHLIINLRTVDPQECIVSIHDLTGRLVVNWDAWLPQSDWNSIFWSPCSLPSGLYIITVTGFNGQSSTAWALYLN